MMFANWHRLIKSVVLLAAAFVATLHGGSTMMTHDIDLTVVGSAGCSKGLVDRYCRRADQSICSGGPQYQACHGAPGVHMCFPAGSNERCYVENDNCVVLTEAYLTENHANCSQYGPPPGS